MFKKLALLLLLGLGASSDLSNSTHLECLDNQIIVDRCFGNGKVCANLDFCKRPEQPPFICRKKWKQLEISGASGLVGSCPKRKERCRVERCTSSEPSVSPTLFPTLEPTIFPTSEDPVSPTLAPSVSPTSEPSVSRSLPPTATEPPTTAIVEESDDSSWAWSFTSLILIPIAYVVFTHPDETMGWLKHCYSLICCQKKSDSDDSDE